MESSIDTFFWWCVGIMGVIGDITGWGYNLANIIIFVILQPALICFFFLLWLNEKRKMKGLCKRQSLVV